MFAALTFDREPLIITWSNFLGLFNSWVQTVGGFAAFGLVLGLIGYAVLHRGRIGGPRSWTTALVIQSALLSLTMYLLLGLLLLPDLIEAWFSEKGEMPTATGLRLGAASLLDGRRGLRSHRGSGTHRPRSTAAPLPPDLGPGLVDLQGSHSP